LVRSGYEEGSISRRYAAAFGSQDLVVSTGDKCGQTESIVPHLHINVKAFLEVYNMPIIYYIIVLRSVF
jgi:hypothetical protein